MSTKYSDRFTEASNELQDKNAFVCETCKKTYFKDEAVKREMTCCNRTMKELLQESFGP
jgi:predicted metal-binding protein